MRSIRISRLAVTALLVTAVLLQGSSGPTVAAKRSTSVVPGDFGTIQAAIDAAAPGDTVRVRKGTYAEQLKIDKDLTIVGAGLGKTTVRAPSTLVPNPAGRTSIVEISDGASVDISRLTVAGPAAGSCEDGPLGAGIRVNTGAHLEFSFGAVRDIHSTPKAACGAAGFVVGAGAGPPASASIHHAIITNYQSAGVLVLGEGSVGDVSHSVIRGPGAVVGTYGIELAAGAVGAISHNVVSGNVCPAGDPSCGTDWFDTVQVAGISAGGGGPGTVITHNLIFDNQVGMLLAESDEISHNRMVDNEFFGLVLVGVSDGRFTVDHGSIRGGGGGLWAIGLYTDMTIVLDGVRFSRLSGPAVEVLDDDPSIPDDPYYSVTIIGGP